MVTARRLIEEFAGTVPANSRYRLTERSNKLFEIAKENIDWEAGVIRGVQLLARYSENGREYTEAAMKDAVRLYEGAPVFFNHEAADKERDSAESIGWIANVRIDGERVVGDFHVLKSDYRAPKLFEIAEKNPTLVAFSHAAYGDGETVGGKYVVNRLDVVESLDLVTRGGVNRSLFESVKILSEAERKPAMKTVRVRITEHLRKLPTSTLGLTRVLEMVENYDDQSGEEPLMMDVTEGEGEGDTPPATPKPEDDLLSALESAAVAIIRSGQPIEQTIERLRTLLEMKEAASAPADNGDVSESLRKEVTDLRLAIAREQKTNAAHRHNEDIRRVFESQKLPLSSTDLGICQKLSIGDVEIYAKRLTEATGPGLPKGGARDGGGAHIPRGGEFPTGKAFLQALEDGED